MYKKMLGIVSKKRQLSIVMSFYICTLGNSKNTKWFVVHIIYMLDCIKKLFLFF